MALRQNALCLLLQQLEVDTRSNRVFKSAIVIKCYACNDCGRRKFHSIDSVHQHQRDLVSHTCASKFRTPIGSVRECSRCPKTFDTADKLEQHFAKLHALTALSPDDEALTWQKIAGHFQSTWKNRNKKLHAIHKIFKVYNPAWRVHDFESYKQKLKSDVKGKKSDYDDGDSVRKVLEDGNQVVRFHGTRWKCGLGRRSSEQLCSDKTCSVCRILEAGFKTSKSGMEHRFQRFGKGIYSSKTSSQANDYVQSSEEDGTKAMVVCKVLAGRTYRSLVNLEELSSPPRGYHSVQGDPGPVLNDDELVVYDSCAILPAYIILYSSD